MTRFSCSLEDHFEKGTRPVDELPHSNGVSLYPANVDQQLIVASENKAMLEAAAGRASLDEKRLLRLAADGQTSLVDVDGLTGLVPVNEDELQADATEKEGLRRRVMHQVRMSIDQSAGGLGAKKTARHRKRRGNPLDRTGICFNGLLEDIKERYPLYKSDILDGIHVHAAVVCSFIFITCLSSTLMFATLLSTHFLNFVPSPSHMFCREYIFSYGRYSQLLLH